MRGAKGGTQPGWLRLSTLGTALALHAVLSVAAPVAAEGPPVGGAMPQREGAGNGMSRAGIPKAGLVLRGVVGKRQVQMQLRPKPDEEDGVEGEYFVFGQGQRILLAGEFDGDSFWLEESANGTDVSGQWEGKREADGYAGQWRAADEGAAEAFQLHLLAAPRPPVPAARSARQPATRSTAVAPRGPTPRAD